MVLLTSKNYYESIQKTAETLVYYYCLYVCSRSMTYGNVFRRPISNYAFFTSCFGLPFSFFQ
jgi:hypothetical protein